MREVWGRVSCDTVGAVCVKPELVASCAPPPDCLAGVWSLVARTPTPLTSPSQSANPPIRYEWLTRHANQLHRRSVLGRKRVDHGLADDAQVMVGVTSHRRIALFGPAPSGRPEPSYTTSRDANRPDRVSRRGVTQPAPA